MVKLVQLGATARPGYGAKQGEKKNTHTGNNRAGKKILGRKRTRKRKGKEQRQGRQGKQETRNRKQETAVLPPSNAKRVVSLAKEQKDKKISGARLNFPTQSITIINHQMR